MNVLSAMAAVDYRIIKLRAISVAMLINNLNLLLNLVIAPGLFRVFKVKPLPYVRFLYPV